MTSPLAMNFMVTLVYESSKRLVLLPKEIEYLKLLRYVGKKFDINDNSVISLYYKMGSETFEVNDDDDLQFFVDEEWARNGSIYLDWYDLEAQEPKTPQKRRTNVNSCPTQIVPIPFIKDAIGISKWAGPAEWRQYSYNPMNSWMTQQEDSTNNTYDPSHPSTSQGYMFHQLKGESSTPYESYHLDDL
ncbi:hypothetical protein Tco_1443906 [Tanacetum coccineum]